jgi:4'-phosphopantetheinyl transferase
MKPDRVEDLDRAVVVWIAPLAALHDSLDAFAARLDSREIERAGRFHFPEDRARFVAGRGLLRLGLRRFAPHLPGSIELAYTGLGRPVLPEGQSGPHFSISHTHDLVAVAFTNEARVGIDIEYLQPALDVLELGERIFSADDFRAFQTLPPDERRAAFYRAWTRKEAYLKALGEGIATSLQQITVSFGADDVSGLTDTRDAAAAAWRLYGLPIPDGYAGALACDDAGRMPHWRHLQLRTGDIVAAEDHP